MLDYSLTQCLLLTLNKLLFVQTIAIIPVLPRGVLQLGSTNVVSYPSFSNWDYNISFYMSGSCSLSLQYGP